MNSEYKNLPDGRTGRVPFLSAAQVEDLEDIFDIETPGFLDYIDQAAKDVWMTGAVKAGKGKPSDIQKELDRALAAISGLSTYAQIHIWKQLRNMAPDESNTYIECESCGKFMGCAECGTVIKVATGGRDPSLSAVRMALETPY